MPTRISRLRERAYQRQSGRCCYCNSPMWQSNPNMFAAKYGISMAQAKRFQCTAEHLSARQEGGPTSRNNIAAACRYCNQARHRRRVAASSSHFKVLVARRLRRCRWHPHWAFQSGIVSTSQFVGQ
jgi:5-methylcytosine-specific restriction endonuclease McrA